MEKFKNVYQDAALMKKVLLNEADEMEQRELDKRLAANPELQKVYEQLQNGETLKTAFAEYQQYSSRKAYESFLQHVGDTTVQTSKPKLLRMRWYAVAAAVVLAMGVSFYMLNTDLPVEKQEVGRPLIQPGSSQAKLTLPDGSMIDVNQKKDVSVMVDGVQVQYKKGVLSYQPSQHKLQEETQGDRTAQTNELIIPRGGENTVILADGTTVYMNAGSRLIYPVRFVGKQRVVTLEGEAYFDVVKDEEHPFVVHTHLGEVTVLGTSFNVNAYAGAGKCYTTLVEGKVTFSAPNQKTVTLQPGEQAIVSAEGVEKHTVDIDEYIGWIKGVYTFNNCSLEDIMKTFERWYDIQVYFETPALRHITYTGNLKRYNTINSLLDALELTGDLTYKINGRNILIYDKTKELE